MKIIKKIKIERAPTGRPVKHTYPELAQLNVGDGFEAGLYTQSLRAAVNSAITALVRTATVSRSESKKKFSVLKAKDGQLYVIRWA